MGQTGQRGGAGARWRAGPCGATRGDGLLREWGRWPAALGLGSRGPSAGGGKLGRAVLALGCERDERAEEGEAMGLRKGGSGSGRFLGLGWVSVGFGLWVSFYFSIFYF